MQIDQHVEDGLQLLGWELTQTELLQLIADLSNLAARAPMYPVTGGFHILQLGHVDAANRYSTAKITFKVKARG